jgi:iron complex transport system substrate-binding protein
MRAFAFASAISIAASAGAAAPQRVASLNLCTDEIVLALAAPGQIVSVTHLSQDRRESALWRRAQAYKSNDGSMIAVAALRPDLVIAMGGGGRDRALIARAIGAKLLVLPYAQSFADLEWSIGTVAKALGRADAGRRLIGEIDAARAAAPLHARDGIFLSDGGRTIASDGLGAQWLRLAGIRQRPLPGGRIEAEALLASPPRLLVTSDYRADQISRPQEWIDHPALRRIRGARRIMTDGRRWTCMGPTLLREIKRLRAITAQLP